MADSALNAQSNFIKGHELLKNHHKSKLQVPANIHIYTCISKKKKPPNSHYVLIPCKVSTNFVQWFKRNCVNQVFITTFNKWPEGYTCKRAKILRKIMELIYPGYRHIYRL